MAWCSKPARVTVVPASPSQTACDSNIATSGDGACGPDRRAHAHVSRATARTRFLAGATGEPLMTTQRIHVAGAHSGAQEPGAGEPAPQNEPGEHRGLLDNME